jgi:hypothetical protein
MLSRSKLPDGCPKVTITSWRVVRPSAKKLSKVGLAPGIVTVAHPTASQAIETVNPKTDKKRDLRDGDELAFIRIMRPILVALRGLSVTLAERSSPNRLH